MKNQKNPRCLPKTTVWLLVFALLLQQTWVVQAVQRKTAGLDARQYIEVYYDGTPVADGIILPEDAHLSVHYRFTTDRDNWEEKLENILIPEPLLAVDHNIIDVMATDENELSFRIGELTAFNQEFKSNIWALAPLPPTKKPPPAQDNVSSSEQLKIPPSFKEGDLTPPMSEKPLVKDEPEKEPEKLTISFQIPCILNLQNNPTQYPRNRMMTAPPLRSVQLESGGKMVTMKLLGAATSQALDTAPITITEVALYKQDGGTSTKLAENAVVYGVDQLNLRYEFNINEGQHQLIKNNLTTKYLITLPNGLKWKGVAASIVLMADVGSGSQLQFAILNLETDQVYLTFGGDFWSSSFNSLNNAYLEVGCGLDLDNITPDSTELLVNLDGKTSINLALGDRQETAAKIEKTGSDYKENRFDWTITYTPGQNAATPPSKIVDTFDSSSQVFVKGSLKMGGKLVAASDYTLTTTKDQPTVLTCTLPNSGKDAVTFSYQTTLADKALDPGITGYDKDTTVSNSAQLKNDSGNIGQAATTTTTAPSAQKQWMTKTGTPDPQNKKINWTVEINTLDRRIENLKMFDKLPTGLTLDPTSIKINNKLLAEANATLTNPATPDAFSIAFSGTYPAQYKVTYATFVEDKHFEEADSPSFTNAARLSYDWKQYDGTGTNYTPIRLPSIGKGVGIDTKIIQKTGKYDPATHEIEWTITVNPYKVNVESGTITDDLTSQGLTYSEHGILPSGITLESVSSDNKTVKFTVGNIGTNAHSFTIFTEVDNSGDFAYNTPGKKYENKVDFAGIVQTKDVTDSATGSVQVFSEVIAKKCVGYDYSTNKLTWELTVNKNGMPLEGVKVVDTFDPHQSYVSGSAKAKDAPIDDSKITYVANTCVLTITLADINERQVITYETLVDVTSAPFKTDAKIPMGNSAVLKRSTYGDVGPIKASKEIANSILQKSGTLNKPDGKISYHVNINPNGVPMKADTTLTDKLPTGVALDLDTLKLVSASVDKDGKFTANNEDVYTANSPGFLTLDITTNSFTISLPAGNKRYLLQYDCSITDWNQTNYQNKISFNRQSGIDDNINHGNSSVGGGGGGAGGSSTQASLIVNKIDSLRTGVKLAGVKFELHTKIGDTDYKMMEKTTDAAGQLTFFPLSPGRKYTIQEVSVATGYSDPMVGTVKLADYSYTATKEGEVEITITNTPVTGSFEITKKSDKLTAGTFVAVGADEVEFTITDETKGSLYQKTAKSNANGIVKFEDVPFGTYKVHESKTPTYHAPTPDFDVIVSNDNLANAVKKNVKNTFFRPKWNLAKQNSSDSSSMKNVEFQLFLEGKDTPLETATTDSVGKLTFTQLEGGKSYIVKEIAPKGYYQPKDFSFTVNQAEDYNITWKNYSHAELGSGSVTVTKVDADNPATKIAGVKFDIYDDAHPEVILASGATTSNGELKLTGLPLGVTTQATYNTPPILGEKTLMLKETATVGDYVLPLAAVAVTISPSDMDKTLTVKNSKKTADVLLQIVNDWDRPITDTEYELKMPDGSTRRSRSVSVNGRPGMISFFGLPLGSYELVEINTVQYHEKDATIYKIDVSSDGTVKISKKSDNAPAAVDGRLVNVARKGKVTIIRFKNGTTNPMVGATYDIMDSKGVQRGTGTTNEDGEIIFPDLILGETYTIMEKSNEGGYYPTKDQTISLPGKIFNPITGLEEDTDAPIMKWPKTPITNGGGGGNGGIGGSIDGSITNPTIQLPTVPVHPNPPSVIPQTGHNLVYLLVLAVCGAICVIIGACTLKKRKKKE